MPAHRKVSLQQMLKLIEEMEKYRNIEIGLPIHSEKRGEDHWPEIAKILNQIPGEFRSSSEWKRYWIEIKSRARKKAAVGKRRILPHERRILELSRKVEGKDLSKNLKMEPVEILIEEQLEDDCESAAEYLETSENHKYAGQHQDPVSIMEDSHGDRSEVHQDDVPNWVRQVERRRLALEERTTRAIEKMANGIISISGSMDLMSQSMVSLVGSMKNLEESLRPETTKK